MIPEETYKKIVELVPIVCVDVILKYHGKYVLIKREDEPLKGSYWIVGGRAYKGEPTLKTAKRKVKEETGFEAHSFNVVGIYEDHYPKSAWGTPTSSVSVVYSATLKNLKSINRPNVSIRFSNKLPNRLIKKMIWINNQK